MACGKKVQNTDLNAGKVVTRTPALSANNIKLKTSFDSDGVVQDDSYQFKDDAWLTIPEYVLIESGEPLNFTVRLYFNTEMAESFDGVRELYCEYRIAKEVGSSNEVNILNGYYHYFAGCFEDIDYDGEADAINYQPGTQVAQDQDRFVRLEYISGFTESEARVSADIEIDWF
jgi:hypothetical protein